MNASVIDAHCHLQSDYFSNDLPDIIQENRENKIHCICNATAPDDWTTVLDIVSRYPEVSAALGIHPWYITDTGLSACGLLYDYRTSMTAIGETGLDGKHAVTDMKVQLAFFQEHLAIADAIGIPVIAHCIAAYDELIASIKKVKPKVPVIIHAFNGSKQLAQSLASFGCYFSIGGTVTYTYSKKREQMLTYIFENNMMLLETDSPDIPPAQSPDMPNRPINILHIAESASDYLGIPSGILIGKTTHTALALFHITENN